MNKNMLQYLSMTNKIPKKSIQTLKKKNQSEKKVSKSSIKKIDPLQKTKIKLSTNKTVHLKSKSQSKPQSKSQKKVHKKSKRKHKIKSKKISKKKIINEIFVNDKPSIIVMGNGPSVLKYEYGNIIDSFDEVIRINHYIPSKNVGEKLTTFVASTYADFYKEVPLKANEILIWNEAPKHSDYDYFDKTTRICTPNLLNKLKKDFKFNIWPKAPWCSTGVGLLLYLIMSNKYNKIHIFGFDNLVKDEQVHFFENVKHNHNNHSTNLERNFINYYIASGKLCRLQDSDYLKQKQKELLNNSKE